MMTLRIPDFPDPMIPPISTFLRSSRTCTGRPSSDRPISIGFVTEVIHRPGHMAGSACGSFSMTRMMNRSARLSSANTRMLPGRRPRSDSSAGILLITCAGGYSFPEQDACGPSPRVDHHRQDFRAGQPGVFRHVRPRGNGLLDSCFGAAPAVEPPRDPEDHRGDSRDQRQRFDGRADGDGCRQPSAGYRDDGCGVGAFDAPVDTAFLPEPGQGAGRDLPGWPGPQDPVRHAEHDRCQNGDARHQAASTGRDGGGCMPRRRMRPG